jgi:hypothetical protein
MSVFPKSYPSQVLQDERSAACTIAACTVDACVYFAGGGSPGKAAIVGRTCKICMSLHRYQHPKLR